MKLNDAMYRHLWVSWVLSKERRASVRKEIPGTLQSTNRLSVTHLSRYHCAARAVKMTASVSIAADENVAVAAEYWLPSASNGLPPPLCSELAVGLLLALADDQEAGMLGASKICDDWLDVLLAVELLLPAEAVLEVELVCSGDKLVSTTRLVGTSVELAVNVLLTMAVEDSSDVVEYCVGSAVDECSLDVVGAADEELAPDCSTCAALVHKLPGPRPCKNIANTFESLLSPSRSPSFAHASFTGLVIASSPLTHDSLQPCLVKSDDPQPVMACW
jgi:hypothetical protein